MRDNSLRIKRESWTIIEETGKLKKQEKKNEKKKREGGEGGKYFSTLK